MKVFIPFVDESWGADAPLVPFNHELMLFIRLKPAGETNPVACQVIMEILPDHAQCHFESKTRYGDATGSGKTNL